jgi:hypothetical protein
MRLVMFVVVVRVELRSASCGCRLGLQGGDASARVEMRLRVGGPERFGDVLQ